MKWVFLLLLLSMVSFYWHFECNSQKCCVDICVKWEECRNSIILNSEMNIWERTDQNVRGEERHDHHKHQRVIVLGRSDLRLK